MYQGQVSVLLCVVDVMVSGVTQLHDVVYIVRSHMFSLPISRFSATTHERLASISVRGLTDAHDIAACEITSQLYVTDNLECIWRVSSEGEHIRRWWTKSSSDTFTPHRLSVTSSRVLVTSRYTKQLMKLDSRGKELRRVPLPDYMDYIQHAVESPAGTTFIVVHKNTQLKHDQVSEVNTEGDVLRQFSRSLSRYTRHIAIDSQGNIFVADNDNRRILLLDARLALRRVIIDEQLRYMPYCLCYNEQSGQLLVGVDDGGFRESGVGVDVIVFDVLRRSR